MASNHTHAGDECQILKGIPFSPVMCVITNFGERSRGDDSNTHKCAIDQGAGTEIIPEYGVPYLDLGELCIDLGEKEAAYRLYRKAAARGSANAVERLKMMGGER